MTGKNTFSDLLNISEPGMHAIAKALRENIHASGPHIIEEIRLTDRAACYGIPESGETRLFCYIFPCTRWVHLGFYKGINLPDPEGLLQGTGRELRYVKVHSLEETLSSALEELIKAALIS